MARANESAPCSSAASMRRESAAVRKVISRMSAMDSSSSNRLSFRTLGATRAEGEERAPQQTEDCPGTAGIMMKSVSELTSSALSLTSTAAEQFPHPRCTGLKPAHREFGMTIRIVRVGLSQIRKLRRFPRFSQNDLEIHLLPTAINRQGDRIAGVVLLQNVRDFHGILHFLTVDGHNQIAADQDRPKAQAGALGPGLQSGAFGGAASIHPLNEQTGGRAENKLFCDPRSARQGLNSPPRAGHPPPPYPILWDGLG